MGYLKVGKKRPPYSPSCQLVTLLPSRPPHPPSQERPGAARSVKCQEWSEHQVESFLLALTIAGATLAFTRRAFPLPEAGQTAVHILSASFVHLLAIILLRSLFFSSVFLAQNEPPSEMTISDPVFAFRSVASLVLAEHVEVTFTV